ncbi:HNH endonuclease [Lysinibacillus sp. CD3-6]|uniref:HNH endonuclease n=1 Tax=Lysinibacillus sp. CD3-6 TaxID=2892541 RepID=UPI00116891BE|nr:HNH endonuclease [Lysinibacillus sp. CD3-6]UED79604.1 HNH endonuclease [Lysinibacillus sp. CD3-6]
MITIKKSEIPPSSLEIEKKKASGKYNKEDVIKQLKEEFHNKCYICEHDGPTNINVEHFIPHKEDIDLKFDWGNLYYACGHCNNTKLAKYDNILNCTLEDDDVENNIRLHIDLFPRKFVSVSSVKADIKTLNTVELLEKVYNGSTATKNIEAQNLREYLISDLRDFQKSIFLYYEAEKYSETENMELIKNKIKRHLHDASAFTSFKRWIIKDSEELMKDFGELFLKPSVQ